MANQNTKQIRDKMNKSSIVGGIVCAVVTAVLILLVKLPVINDQSLVSTLASMVHLPIIVSIVKAAYVITSCIALAVIIRFVISKIKPRSNRSSTMLELFYSAVTYVFIILGLVFVLRAFNVDVAAIATTVGILGIVVGFGAESLISDVFTGTCMIFENQYNVGDIIEVNGFRGEVVQIGIRTTSIRDLGGNVKILNNSDIRDVLNCSARQSVTVCDFSVSYSCDLDKVENVLAQTLIEVQNQQPEIFERITYVGVEELAESSVVLRVIAQTSETNIYNGKRMINRAVFLAFQKNNIEIPFPQVDVHTNQN